MIHTVRLTVTLDAVDDATPDEVEMWLKDALPDRYDGASGPLITAVLQVTAEHVEP